MSTFKIRGPIPSVDSDVETLADYFEVKALCSDNHEVSIKDILKKFLMVGDETDDSSITDQEDRINNKLEPVIGAIQRRIVNSRGNYPFTIEMQGNVIAFQGYTSFSSYMYVYLLFATRLNMNVNKKFENIDGTKIFEEISALVAKSYFGQRCSSLVFGTAIAGGFEDKVNDMCTQLNEGVGFVNHGGGEVTENDDTLDIVIWNHFEDRLANKLIGFGQCKTGTSYESSRKDLQPADFCKKWIKTQFNQDPIRLFFIADVIERKKFWKRTVDSGIMFDRIRIMDYLPNDFDDTLINSVCTWSKQAVNFACAS
jgi:hypothetical protein